MYKVTSWIRYDGCSMRIIQGTDPDDIRNRVAVIEKTPRVRIRPAYLRESRGTYEGGGEYLDHKWAEHLDWCYGDKGDDCNNKESKAWCDAMLKLLGYTLEN